MCRGKKKEGTRGRTPGGKKRVQLLRFKDGGSIEESGNCPKKSRAKEA